MGGKWVVDGLYRLWEAMFKALSITARAIPRATTLFSTTSRIEPCGSVLLSLFPTVNLNSDHEKGGHRLSLPFETLKDW